jgi:hypothetical protein
MLDPQRKRDERLFAGIVAVGMLLGEVAWVLSLGTSCCPYPEESGARLDRATQKAVENIPPGATDVEPLRDGWVKYTYEGHRYLFLFNSHTYLGYAAMTRVDWNDTTKASPR